MGIVTSIPGTLVSSTKDSRAALPATEMLVATSLYLRS